MIRTILNEKGGVAKTITAVQLAAGFAKAGKQTLLIDGDPQSCATKLLFEEEDIKQIIDGKKNISTVMVKPDLVRNCIWHTKIENLDMIPSNGDLNHTMNQLMMNPMTSYPVRLQRALKHVYPYDYDEVIIDNNPYFHLFPMNTIVCADEIIIPSNIEYGAINSIKATLEDISMVLDDLEEVKPLKYRILLTKIDRLNIDKEMIRQIRDAYGRNVYITTIRTQNKPVKEAGFTHNLLINDTKSGVAADYRNFIAEVIGGMEE